MQATIRFVGFLFYIVVCGVSSVQGQAIDRDSLIQEIQKKEIPYKVEFNRVCFMANDTIYHFTRFIRESGYIYYQLGHKSIDYSIAENHIYRFEDDRTYRIETMFNPRIDTIYSYRKNSYVEYDTTFSEVEIKDVTYLNSLPLDDLRFSDILQSINELHIGENSRELRLVNFFPGAFYWTHPTFSVEHIVFATNSATCTRIKGESTDLNGFKTTEKESFAVSPKDLKRIDKMLDGIPSQSETCLVGEPWLLEYRNKKTYSNHIISYVCDKYNSFGLRKNRNNLFRVHSLITSLQP
ncbi:MAG: hypothetical protein H6603_06125 [Flavobacteriales bacterium]|nr:hypothetical protein [Flavobacteriales bacterium]MCB9204538.1 hypothetical protein [Flavobacteriales bacterium]